MGKDRMSDLREQLRKAGLVSGKQVKQAKHQDRLHASEVGHAGLQAEREERERRQREEVAAQRQADRARGEERRSREREEAGRQRVAQLIRGGWLREATAGARRFFFVTPAGKISFLDLTEVALRRLASGSAAIVATRGHVRGDFCVVADRAAEDLAGLEPGIVCFWNRGSDRSAPAAGE